jgi:thiol:disulfide interchange protein
MFGSYRIEKELTVKRLFLCALCLAVVNPWFLAKAAASAPLSQTKLAAADKYDPKRDPEKDIKEAVAEATRTHKRILLEVGGEWCSWCHIMDRYFEQNPKLLEYREKNFVTVRINFSRENENKKLLSRYPTIPGYPHIFVLETNGKLVHSQDTSQLESGRSYDLEKFFAFLKRWARS